MSTKEKLYSLIEGLTEEQLNEFVVIFTEIAQKKKEKYNDVESVFSVVFLFSCLHLLRYLLGLWKMFKEV